jgi:hypothetical protein
MEKTRLRTSDFGLDERQRPGTRVKAGPRRLAILAALALCGSVAMRVQAQPATLKIATTNGQSINLDWNTGGALQFAPTLFGPWTTVSSGVSVLSSDTMVAGGPAKFFRVVDNGIAGSPVPLLGTTLTAPIEAAGASIQLLSAPVAEGNARLVVNIPAGVSAPSSSNIITMLVNSNVTFLRDDGVFPDEVANDRNFSAVVNIGTNDLSALNNTIANVPGTNRQSLVFVGRAIVATNTVMTFDTTNFFAGQQITFFTNIFPSGLTQPCQGPLDAYNPFKTLMIIDQSVVQDTNRTWDPGVPVGQGTKMGAWTFGKLMTDMCNTPVSGIQPSDFVLRWLQSYSVQQTINNDAVPAVQGIQSEIITPWLSASAAEGFPANTLDLSIAPFRLLAIVNRVDLRQGTTYGGVVNNSAVPSALGGEARFVFCATDSSGNPLEMTVILEYAVPFSTCEQIQNWAAQWAALNSLTFNTPVGNPTFNIALQAITDQFAKANADPSRPNGSAIHQVRANEILGQQWELRQFNVDNGAQEEPGFLVESPVAATPAFTLNGTATLNKFILSVPDPASFCPETASPPGITIPTFYNGAAFLGGWAPEGSGVFFDSDTPTRLTGSELCVRHILSLNTCNACHTSETGTEFTQVAPRPFNSIAVISGFLLGSSGGGEVFNSGARFTVVDPDTTDNPGVFYSYNDLARRVQDLWNAANCPCFFDIARPILPFQE